MSALDPKPWAWLCNGAGDGWKEADKVVRDPELAARYISQPEKWTVEPLYLSTDLSGQATLEGVKPLDEDDAVMKALRAVSVKVFGQREPAFLSVNEAAEVFNIVRSALLPASAEPVDFQWKTIDGWISCSISGEPDHRQKYAKMMAREVGLGYRELYEGSPPASGAVEAIWRPISEADNSIATVEKYGDVTLRNSYPIWVRDEDGRTYEALWTDHRGGYWWDIESESPVDPVEYSPHPLAMAWPAVRTDEEALHRVAALPPKIRKSVPPAGGAVSVPRHVVEIVTRIANRNEQSAEGDVLAVLLSRSDQPASGAVEAIGVDVPRYRVVGSGLEVVHDGGLVTFSDYAALRDEYAKVLTKTIGRCALAAENCTFADYEPTQREFSAMVRAQTRIVSAIRALPAAPREGR